MKKTAMLMCGIIVAGIIAGCTTPAQKVRQLKLGMMSEEVIERIGEPYTIRAAKIYENEQQEEVWVYNRPWWMVLSMSPESVWVHFEDGKVVQWGKPGDFAGKSGDDVPVAPYQPQKTAK